MAEEIERGGEEEDKERVRKVERRERVEAGEKERRRRILDINVLERIPGENGDLSEQF